MCYQVEKDCKNQLVKPKSFLLTTLKNNGLAASKSNTLTLSATSHVMRSATRGEE